MICISCNVFGGTCFNGFDNKFSSVPLAESESKAVVRKPFTSDKNLFANNFNACSGYGVRSIFVDKNCGRGCIRFNLSGKSGGKVVIEFKSVIRNFGFGYGVGCIRRKSCDGNCFVGFDSKAKGVFVSLFGSVNFDCCRSGRYARKSKFNFYFKSFVCRNGVIRRKDGLRFC